MEVAQLASNDQGEGEREGMIEMTEVCSCVGRIGRNEKSAEKKPTETLSRTAALRYNALKRGLAGVGTGETIGG